MEWIDAKLELADGQERESDLGMLILRGVCEVRLEVWAQALVE